MHITGNEIIGPTYYNNGLRFSAGIADGEVRRDGTFDAGGSANLTISGNRQIVAGRSNNAWNNATCADPRLAREGSDVAAGILLVGTSSATLFNNGSNASRDYAIFGGASSAEWDPASRVLPPSVPGIWTVETTDVRIDHNEIRAGVLATMAGCVPAQLPYAVAVRDGLGPNVPSAHASVNLRLTANGIVTGRRASFDPVPGLDRGGARLVELFGAPGASTYLANNYLAATRGTDLIGLYANGVADVALWNNVVELETITSSGAAVVKRGIVLDAAGRESVNVVNNIVVVWRTAGDDPEAVALEERSASREPLRSLRHNLMFVEAAERDGTGGYVRISGGPTYTKENLDTLLAGLDAEGNLLLPPLFQSRRLEHWRSLTQLSARSPARDSGQAEGAPAEDRFGHPRPLGPGVDIGHHEYTP